MRIKAFGATHTGRIRGHNEDNIYVDGTYRSDTKTDNIALKSRRQNGPYIYAVFDGLGGEACGEQASLIAAMKFREAEDGGTAAKAEAYTAAAHKAILKEAAFRGVRNMGTTVAALIADCDRGVVFNVGDSRVYLFRSGRLRMLTRDHSVIQSMIECGFIDESERHTNPHSGELTQFLGMSPDEYAEPEPDIKTVDLLPGDVFILCSDGLTSELEDEEIGAVIGSDLGKGEEYITVDLIKQAVDKGGSDNVSVITVCIG